MDYLLLDRGAEENNRSSQNVTGMNPLLYWLTFRIYQVDVGYSCGDGQIKSARISSYLSSAFCHRMQQR